MSKYPFGASYNAPDIPDLDWAVLESVSALTFTEPQRTILIKALHRYLVNRAEYQATSSMKDVQRRLTQIHTHATALKDLLRLHHTDKSDVDEQMNLLQAVFGQFPIWMDRNTLLHQLIILVKNTEVTLKDLCKVGQRGRPRQESLRVMIKAWYTVYREAGGRGVGCWWSVDSSEFQGPFLELLYDAQKQVANTFGEVPFFKTFLPSKDALAQMILKTIRNR
jgi:hypothetical protein